MAKQRSNHPTKGILQEISRRERSQITSRIQFWRSAARTRVESFIPSHFRWILPYIGESYAQWQAEQRSAAPDTQEAPIDLAQVSVLEPEPGEARYPPYACQCGNDLSQTPATCQLLQQQVPITQTCWGRGFPAPLLVQAEIRGYRGRYRVEQGLPSRGWGRLYQGTQLGDGSPVVIKEYLLPDLCFGRSEIQQRQRAFAQSAGLHLADGRMQDFRLLMPWDAIADINQSRCYLIIRGHWESAPTLRAYLKHRGAIEPLQVRQILNQVLQSLEFLHSQKFQLPSGQVRSGIAHGNLSLDSLLVIEMASRCSVYLCDLALWESLFAWPGAAIADPVPADDLVALGYLGFDLLAGAEVDRNSQPVDPNGEQGWPLPDPALNHFLLRLISPTYPFDSAEAARQALLQLPLSHTSALVAGEPIALDDTDQRYAFRVPWWSWAVLGLGFLGVLAWWWLPRSPSTASVEQDVLPCCIQQVPAVPKGTFSYTAERQGTAHYAMQQPNLVGWGHTLQQALTRQHPELKLLYQPEATGEAVIQTVQSGQRDFALTSLAYRSSTLLEQKPVAYDGLVVFVAFSYARRNNSLPKVLNGQITLEQLRQIYTGQVANWRQLGGPNLPIKLYVPTETEAIQIFEQRVLQDDRQIALFRNLLTVNEKSSHSFIAMPGAITARSTFQTLQDVIRDFEEDQVGAIAFGTFSKVFGQCSAYPLAIGDGKQPPVQVVIQDQGKPIDPTVDLCGKKGSYKPDLQAFQTGRYPLAYPITVTYLRDNSRSPIGEKFAEILRTQEGQCLLQKTGLVPIESPSQRCSP